MIDAFDALWNQAQPAFGQERTWRRARTLALSALVDLNFRDEKTVLGVGDAQVRTQAAVETVPCFVVAAYAFLLLAARKSDKDGSDCRCRSGAGWRLESGTPRLG